MKMLAYYFSQDRTLELSLKNISCFHFFRLGTEQSGAAKMITSITLVQSLIPLISLLLCLALYVVRHYVSPGTSWFIQFLVTVSFTFGFFGLALMPIDLSLTTSVDSR